MNGSKIPLAVLSALLLVLVLAQGLKQANDEQGKEESVSVPTNTTAALAGSPPHLRELHSQASQLLDGTPSEVKRRIASFNTPVVLNKWASWCAPCKFEFPFLQNASLKYGKKIAFLGLDSGDNSDDAAQFLKKFPVSYPSYKDPREKTAQSLEIGNNYPVTVFYDKNGKVAFIHQGGYSSLKKLDADIKRYLL